MRSQARLRLKQPVKRPTSGLRSWLRRVSSRVRVRPANPRRFQFFLATTFVSGAVAFLALPPLQGDGPVLAPFSIDVPGAVTDTQGQIRLRSVSFHESHGDGSVDLIIALNFSRPAEAAIPVSISLGLPHEVGGVSRCEGGLPGETLECRLEDQRLVVGAALGNSPANASGIWAMITLDDTVGVGWRDSHARVTVNLPKYVDMEMRDSVLLRTEYQIPDTYSLSWSGPAPEVWGRKTSVWSYTDNSYDAPPGPTVGVKDGVEQADSHCASSWQARLLASPRGR